MNETCKHLHRIGDNYGESCRDCGKQLSGYGWGGWFGNNQTGRETCIHLWIRAGETEDAPRVCIYCQAWETEAA